MAQVLGTVFILKWGPGGRLNIKMLSCQYQNSHHKDKMVSWPIPDKTVFTLTWAPGGHLNIKMLSYQYRCPYVKDKTVSLSLTWESPYLGKAVFILTRAPDSLVGHRGAVPDQQCLPAARRRAQQRACWQKAGLLHGVLLTPSPAASGAQPSAHTYLR